MKDNEMIVGVIASLLISDTPIIFFVIEDNMVGSWKIHLLYQLQCFLGRSTIKKHGNFTLYL